MTRIIIESFTLHGFTHALMIMYIEARLKYYLIIKPAWQGLEILATSVLT